ncbi:hypothetical protein [Cytophaga hutchinsonii]|uniref:Uncharacterized protein n=2 Tax=Cytophaga hutchinsonii TaxID=985 RepID=A0A6N4ST79_CYTH3|nr:hypothetical protein [Cytophaga hutchinsonii]ABG59587.1 conserved hypothetical protein [Cytophaga hutchinsonii ATCC 33406]SFX67657.1 hypothetical protein SAMN04487930_107201 [Cytophaga hutchinsonii ATCC 33406]
MNKTTLKSIGAILAGFITGAALSMAADFIMEKTGMMSMQHFKQSSPAILLLVIGYRFVFNVLGCYLAARLAPGKPMKHALIIGVIGTVLSIVGTVAMWDMAIPFYNITIIVMSLPSAWLGGKLFLQTQGKSEAYK